MSTSSALRCLSVRSPAATTASSRILMLTSWSEQSTPAELSIASVLMRPPPSAYSIRAALRQPEVAALADHAAAQLGGVDAHGVVGLVAGVGVRLASTPSRRCRCRRSRAGRRAPSAAPGSGRSARAWSASMPSAVARLVATAGSTSPSAGRRRRPPRSARCRSRPTTSAAARTGACAPPSSAAGSGSGSRKMSRWLNAPISRICARQQHAVAEHVARHVADADDRERLALHVAAELAEVALDRLPGARAR